MAKGPKPRPVEERFWTFVVRDGVTDCWLWSGNTTPFGYGQLKVGKLGVDRRPAAAHRMSYEMHHGPIPSGLCVLHRCDVPACVNPAHLFVGTKRDNAEDRTAKGRSTNGSARRTHCPRGHAYDLIIVTKKGPERTCQTCRRDQSRSYHIRKLQKENRA